MVCDLPTMVWPSSENVPVNRCENPAAFRQNSQDASVIAVWKMRDGDFGYGDVGGGRIAGKQRLNCEMTVMGGRIAWDYNQRDGRDYRELGPDYGLRDGIDFIVRPPARRR